MLQKIHCMGDISKKRIRNWNSVPTWKAVCGIKNSVFIWLAMHNIFAMTLVPLHCLFCHMPSFESVRLIITKLWFADHWWSTIFWQVVHRWAAEPS